MASELSGRQHGRRYRVRASSRSSGRPSGPRPCAGGGAILGPASSFAAGRWVRKSRTSSMCVATAAARPTASALPASRWAALRCTPSAGRVLGTATTACSGTPMVKPLAMRCTSVPSRKSLPPLEALESLRRSVRRACDSQYMYTCWRSHTS